MSSRVFIPFNNNPIAAPSLKTSSYTVPAGRYAKIIIDSPNFTLNGATIFPSDTLSVSASASSTATTVNNTAGVSFSAPVYVTAASATCNIQFATAYAGYGSGSHGAFGRLYYSRSTNGTGSLTTGYVSTSALWVIANANYNPTYGTSTSSITVTFSYFPNALATEMWVPSGTVLSGDRFFVTEYNTVA